MAPSRLFALVLQSLSLVTKKKTSRTQGSPGCGRQITSGDHPGNRKTADRCRLKG
jgi:hypothetical protein